MAPIRIVCPVCDAVNQLPEERLGQGPKCGRCKSPLFAGEPVALDEARFGKHATQGDIPLVVDFWAGWCQPCRVFAPTFQAAAARHEPRARFAKVDVDAAPGLSQRYNVSSIPTLMMIKKGQVVDRVAGALPPGQLEAWLQKTL